MMQSSAAAGVDQSVSTSHRQVDPVETGVDDNAGADDHDHQRRDHRKVTLSVGVLGPSTQPDLTCHLNENSPAISACQAKAQPCLRLLSTTGSAAGNTT